MRIISSRPRERAGQRSVKAMRHRVLQVVGSAAVLTLAVGACSEEPSLYLGGPPGPDAEQSLSTSSLTIVVGDSALLGARTEDEVGNLTGTPPTVTACSGAVAVGSSGPEPETNYTTSVWIRGVSLGETCLVVSSGGGIEDTVRVTIGPAGIVILGPDTLISAEAGDYTIEFYDGSGALLSGSAPVLWGSTDSGRVAIGPSGNAVSPGPVGSLRVVARAAGGAVADKDVVVVPGVFNGTIANVQGGGASADFADTVVVKPGTRAWDGNEFVTVGGLSPWLIERTTDSIVILVPAAPTGSQEVVVGNVGTSNFFGAATITIGSTYTNTFPGPDISDGPFPMEFFINIRAPNGAFYTLDQSLGLDLEITVTLEWQALDGEWVEIEDAEDSDHDLLFTDCAFAELTNTDGATPDNNPEEATVIVPATECWLMWLDWFDDPRNNVMALVTITSP